MADTERRKRNKGAYQHARLGPEQIERDLRAFDLKASGVPYHVIASTLGCSLSTAHRSVTRVVRQVLRDHGVEEEAAAMLAGLDRAVQQMTLILRAETSTPEQKMNATSRLLAVYHRKADLLGLDAPKKMNVGFISAEEFNSALEDARAERDELAARRAERATRSA